MLIREERQYNRDVAKARVIVGNYFCRIQQLWNITKHCYCCSESEYDMYMTICIFATNFHEILHPLRDSDGNFYRRWVKVIRQEEIERPEKSYSNVKDLLERVRYGEICTGSSSLTVTSKR